MIFELKKAKNYEVSPIYDSLNEFFADFRHR